MTFRGSYNPKTKVSIFQVNNKHTQKYFLQEKICFLCCCVSGCMRLGIKILGVLCFSCVSVTMINWTPKSTMIEVN